MSRPITLRWAVLAMVVCGTPHATQADSTNLPAPAAQSKDAKKEVEAKKQVLVSVDLVSADPKAGRIKIKDANGKEREISVSKTFKGYSTLKPGSRIGISAIPQQGNDSPEALSIIDLSSVASSDSCACEGGMGIGASCSVRGGTCKGTCPTGQTCGEVAILYGAICGCR